MSIMGTQDSRQLREPLVQALPLDWNLGGSVPMAVILSEYSVE